MITDDVPDDESGVVARDNIVMEVEGQKSTENGVVVRPTIKKEDVSSEETHQETHPNDHNDTSKAESVSVPSEASASLVERLEDDNEDSAFYEDIEPLAEAEIPASPPISDQPMIAETTLQEADTTMEQLDMTEANTDSETQNMSASRDSTDMVLESSPEKNSTRTHEIAIHVNKQAMACKDLAPSEDWKEDEPNNHLHSSQPLTVNNTKADPEELISDVEHSTENSVFFNRGLALWEASRNEWLGPRSDTDSSVRAVAIPVDVDEIIDILFASPRQIREDGGPRQFPKPVALPQMIDLLIDLWEAEGIDM